MHLLQETLARQVWFLSLLHKESSDTAHACRRQRHVTCLASICHRHDKPAMLQSIAFVQQHTLDKALGMSCVIGHVFTGR